MDHKLEQHGWNIETLLKLGGTGAVSGLVGTVPMTAAMLLMHRYLPLQQRGSLPPRKIVMQLAGRVGIRRHMDEPERTTAVLVAHFAYGAGAGVLYGPISRFVSLPGIVKGITYGVLVWVVGYLGWLPVMDLPEAATEETSKRNALMIGAHVIWGGATGIVAGLLTRWWAGRA